MGALSRTTKRSFRHGWFGRREGSDDSGRSDAPDDGLKVALMRRAEQSQHIDVRAGGAGRGEGL